MSCEICNKEPIVAKVLIKDCNSLNIGNKCLKNLIVDEQISFIGILVGSNNIVNPKSGFSHHICEGCGKHFVCSEHCRFLWKNRKCRCNECDRKESTKLYLDYYEQKCRTKEV